MEHIDACFHMLHTLEILSKDIKDVIVEGRGGGSVISLNFFDII